MYLTYAPMCAYFQMSYFKSSPVPPLSAFERSHVKAGGQPRSPSPGARCGFGGSSSWAPTMWGTTARKKPASGNISFLDTEQSQHITNVLLVGITGIGRRVFIHPPHKN